jgi:hypothetical protein
MALINNWDLKEVSKPPRPPELPSQVWINRPPSEEKTL